MVPSFAPATPGSELTVLEMPAPSRPFGELGGTAVHPEGNAAADGAAASGRGSETISSAAVRPGRSADAEPRSRAAAPASPAGGADRVRLAPMICFDAIFPEINVAFARAEPEPEILVNPTNDAWYGYSSGPYQFLAIVRMRAIEAGKAVIRPAYAGVSAVILPTGEVAPGALEVGPVDPDRAPDSGRAAAAPPRARSRACGGRPSTLDSATSSPGRAPPRPSARSARRCGRVAAAPPNARRPDAMAGPTQERLAELTRRLEALRGSL